VGDYTAGRNEQYVTALPISNKEKRTMAKKTTTEVPAGMKSKTEIVKELLAKGVESPKDISAAAQTEYKMDIAPSYASIIKSQLKKGKGKGKRVKGKRGVTARTAKVASGNEHGNGDDFALENLALRFALKAGSIESAIAALEKLR
jgi:hypothetical protein